MTKIINIAIGVVIVALLATGGTLTWLHYHGDQAQSTTLERTYEKWKKTVDDNPDNSFARANLAATLMDMGKVDDAISEFKTALDQEPKNFAYMFRLGLAYRAVDDKASALDVFKQAAELSPDGEKNDDLYWAGQTSYDMGDLDGAKDFVQQSIKDNDMIWNSHYLLGQILEQQGDKDGAKKEYQTAVKFNPASQEAQDALKRVSS